MPAAESDLSNGASTFSLFCDATPEEIEEVKQLKTESHRDYRERLLQWQEMLTQRQKFTKLVCSRLCSEKFVPDIRVVEWCTSIAFSRELGRNETNYSYFNFDGSIMQLKYFMHPEAIKKYKPPIDKYKQGIIRDLCTIGPEDTHYCIADGPIDLVSPLWSSFNCIFDIQGRITITSSKVTFGENAYFWPMGSLVFRPANLDCPIGKIKIIACNSTKPIQVIGDVDFSATPQINLEFINAAQIELKLKFKPQQ